VWRRRDVTPGFLVRKPEERDNFETLDLHEKMVLKWILTDLCMWLSKGTSNGLL
jgi:hypothetical protein